MIRLYAFHFSAPYQYAQLREKQWHPEAGIKLLLAPKAAVFLTRKCNLNEEGSNHPLSADVRLNVIVWFPFGENVLAPVGIT